MDIETHNEYTMDEIREMTREELRQHFKDFSQRLVIGEIGRQTMTKFFIQLMKIDGKDPLPALERQGMLELAKKSGWI